MESFGQFLKSKREEKGLLLRHVAAHLDIDQAILSKIESGKRNLNKEHIEKLSEILGLDRESLMIYFLSEKIYSEISEENCAGKALRLAEKRIKLNQKKNDKKA